VTLISEVRTFAIFGITDSKKNTGLSLAALFYYKVVLMFINWFKSLYGGETHEHFDPVF
jgi:hypothetical protein